MINLNEKKIEGTAVFSQLSSRYRYLNDNVSVLSMFINKDIDNHINLKPSF